MSSTGLKAIGMVLLIVCAGLVYIAVDRYNENANKVKFMNQVTQGSPLGGREGGFKPATPDATKYAGAGAAVAGLSGIVCLAMSVRRKDGEPAVA